MGSGVSATSRRASGVDISERDGAYVKLENKEKSGGTSGEGKDEKKTEKLRSWRIRSMHKMPVLT